MFSSLLFLNAEADINAFYYSQQIYGKFSKTVNFGIAVNIQYGEGDTCVVPDGCYLWTWIAKSILFPKTECREIYTFSEVSR